jgi:hypothetical protein
MKDITEKTKQSCIEFAANPILYGVKWTDITTHSRSDAERIPTIFEAKIGLCRIVILTGHYRQFEWIMNCPMLGLNEWTLPVDTAQAAAEEALIACMKRIDHFNSAFKVVDITTKTD